MFLTRHTALLLSSIGVVAAQPSPSVIGEGWGLDHVAIVFPSESAAKELFFSKLGFSVRAASRPPFGFDHAIVDLESPSYIELHWMYDRSKIPTERGGLFAFDSLRRKNDKGGGVAFFMIDVSPFGQAVERLRASGLSVSDPAGTAFRVSELSGSGVPYGGPIGLVEYGNNPGRLRAGRDSETRTMVEKEVPDPRRTAGEIHANTARKLRSVWVAVPDVQQAVMQSRQLGFAPGSERQLVILGAHGREVLYGAGAIVFWQPNGNSGPLTTLIEKQGFGPFGVSVEVANIEKAHEIAEHGTRRKLPLQPSDTASIFLVPADSASGTWIEFMQPRRRTRE